MSSNEIKHEPNLKQLWLKFCLLMVISDLLVPLALPKKIRQREVSKTMKTFVATGPFYVPGKKVHLDRSCWNARLFPSRRTNRVFKFLLDHAHHGLLLWLAPGTGDNVRDVGRGKQRRDAKGRLL